MRLPNGYGSVSNMGKGRRNPWRVRITVGWEYDEEKITRKQKSRTLGYYPTKKAALQALAAFNERPYDLDAERTTFKEAYESWAARELADKSNSRRAQFNASFKKCEPLYNVRMKEIRTYHLQDVLDRYKDMSESSVNNLKSVFHEVFRYCMENDVIQKDYSKFVKVKLQDQEDQEGIHTAYTEEEIALLWDNVNMKVPLYNNKRWMANCCPVDTLLILIYTGMRPGELLNMKTENVHLEGRYMVGGSKTKAGRGRIIPIHDDIFPLVEKRMAAGGEYLIPYKNNLPAKLHAYRHYMHDPVMENLKIKHLPHDGRHTFATFADRFEINEVAKDRIMGHTSKSLSKQIYTHKAAEELVAEVNKIVFYKPDKS